MGMDTTSELKAFLELTGMLFTDPRTCVLFALLACAAVSDFRTFRIPNWLTGGGIVFALAHSVVIPFAGPNLTASLGGMVLGFLIMAPLYALRTMGAGDVKLMAMIGAFVGTKDVLYVILFSFIVAGLAALSFAASHGVVGRMFRNVRDIGLGLAWSMTSGIRPAVRQAPGVSVGSLAYGVSIAIGTTCFVVARHFYLI